MSTANLITLSGTRLPGGKIPALAFLFLTTLSSPAQLLSNLKAFPDRIAVGDPLTAASDHKEGPKGIASADFNGDGRPDIAAGNLDGTVTVLMGQGGGKFAPPVHLRTGAQELRAVLAVDLNGDGIPDIATASPMDGKLLLYFNNGQGSFGAATALEGWIGVRCLTSGDFDGDGITDLAAAGPGIGVRHFRGTGGGAFGIMGDLPRLSPPSPEIPRPVYAMRTIRSRDGLRDDLLVTHADSEALYVLSTVPVDRSAEPPIDLSNLPGWKARPSPVVLHEVQIQNATTLLDADGTAQPWVELLNKSASPVNLGGWQLRSEHDAWGFPSVTVESGRMLVVFLSGKNRITGQELHSSFLLKQNSKDLSLIQPNGDPAQILNLAQHSIADISYGLAPDLDALVYFDVPSPGAPNNAGLKNLNDLNPDTVTTLSITPRHPAVGQSVKVRVTMPEQLTGTSTVRNVWFSATPGLSENHHLLHRTAPGIFEEVLPQGAYLDTTPHRVLARLRDGTGNDYTSEVHRGLDETETNPVAPSLSGRLLTVASIPSPKVKAFEVGTIGSPSHGQGAPADLVLADDARGLLRVYRAGPGARRFEPTPSQNIAVRGAPRDVKLADIDGDGWLDATVVLRSLDLAMTYKNENGVLRATGELPTGRSPREAVMADFTGDGKPDAAVINRYSADISILPSGIGSAGLVSLDQIYSVNGEITGLLVKDMNGDGRDDVVQLHRASGETSIRYPDPNGTLGAPVYVNMGTSGPSGIAVADVNNDNKPDILTANLGQGSISVLLAKDDGAYKKALTFSSAGGMFAIAVADFDKDGNLDVVAGLFDCRVQFFSGDGAGNFTATYAVSFAYESRVMVTGDFDHDGDIDIAGAGYAGDMVTLENRGAATAAGWYKRIYPSPSSGKFGAERIRITDLNSDGDEDLIIGSGSGVMAYTGGPGMGFVLSQKYGGGLSLPVSDVITRDLDGDGNLEMVVACRAASCINILTQKASGDFELVTQADVPSGRYLASGDLDGDGKPDLVGTGDVLWTVLSSRPPKVAAPDTTPDSRAKSTEVVINEVLSQNTGVPIAADNGRKSDYVEIFNGATTGATLTGWQVRLQSTQENVPVNQSWMLPAITAPAKGHAVLIFSAEPGTNHSGFTLPAEGGTLTLMRPDGSEADRVDYPRAFENVSWSRYLDGHPSFHADSIPSPGMSNLDNGTVAPEVKLTAPAPTTMEAGKPLTFTAKGLDDSGIISLSLLWNRLDAPLPEPRRIVLYDDGMHEDAGAVDGFFSGKLEPGLPAGSEVQFYLEAVDLSGEVLVLPDSAELIASGAAPVAWSFSLTTPPPLEITEVCSYNVAGRRDDAGGHSDWVTVRNNGAEPLDMNGILLAKSPLSGFGSVYSYPSGLILAPGGEITVSADNNPSQGVLHTPFTLDAGGDELALLAVTPSGARQWIHSLTVPASPSDAIYRMLPGSNLRAMTAPAADLSNWSGIAVNPAGENLATVTFFASTGTTYLIEGDATGAPEAWTLLQTIPGDGTLHMVTRPVSEMAALRALPGTAAPSLRVDSVVVSGLSVGIYGEAARATSVSVFYGYADGGTNPSAWVNSVEVSGAGAPHFELLLPPPQQALTAYTPYYYRLRAVNPSGEIWSQPMNPFRTSLASDPTVNSLSLGELNPHSALVKIDFDPMPPVGSAVTVLAGTEDAASNFAEWQQSIVARKELPDASSPWTASLSGLASDTIYFVRVRVSGPGGTNISHRRLTFRTPDAAGNLVRNLQLSEIMYHPAVLSPVEAAAGFEEEDFEFIELHNPSDEGMDLSGLWFENGLEFDFPFSGAPVIPPGGFAVIAANPHAFGMRYGANIPPAGWTLHPFRHARLSNGGENITLRTADGTLLFDIPYRDGFGDGDGFSLEFHSPSGPHRPETDTDYFGSRITGGTPGQAAQPKADQTFIAWQGLNFSAAQLNSPAISGSDADPDKDGLTNFAEYACGTNPNIKDSKDVLSIRNGSPEPRLRRILLTFPMSTSARDAVFSIEGWDRTLTNWITDAADISHYNSGPGYSSFQGNPVQTSYNYYSAGVLSSDGKQILATIAVNPLNSQPPWDSRLFRLKITQR